MQPRQQMDYEDGGLLLYIELTIFSDWPKVVDFQNQRL